MFLCFRTKFYVAHCTYNTRVKSWESWNKFYGVGIFSDSFMVGRKKSVILPISFFLNIKILISISLSIFYFLFFMTIGKLNYETFFWLPRLNYRTLVYEFVKCLECVERRFNPLPLPLSTPRASRGVAIGMKIKFWAFIIS